MKALMDLLQVILPVFAALFLGWLCRIKGILTPDGALGVRKAAVNVTLPAVSLITFAHASYEPQHLLVAVWMYGVCFAALKLGEFWQRRLGIPGKVMPFLCTCFESGMLGFSLYPMIYGDLAPLAILALGQIVFIYTVFKARLSGARGARAILREMAHTPALWTLSLGLLLGVTGLYGRMEASGLQAVFDKTVSFVSTPTSFMILLTIGYDLDLKGIEWRKIGGTVLARLGIMGALMALTLTMNHFLLGDLIQPGAIWMLFLLPAPMLVPAFSRDHSEAAYTASALSIQTLITGAAFILLAIFRP